MTQELISALLFMYTESSLHAGTGSSVSAVDLPIQRERATQYPMVAGSGVKGALRSQANLPDSEKTVIFGPDDRGKASEHAGALSVGDAQIVLFPVRALSGVFAYVTCAHVLARIARLVEGFPTIPSVADKTAHITSSSAVSAGSRVVLEEYTFTAKADGAVDALAAWLAEYALPQGEAYDYWRGKMRASLVVLPDTDFRDFVVSSTEISTHVKLDRARKTVETGALWTREALPSDALLMSAVIARRSRAGDEMSAQQIAEALSAALAARIQLGGDETTGQGVVALRWF